MPDILYSSESHPGFILLSDEFILQHMPKSNGTYVKVYLYAYQGYVSRRADVSTQSIARALGLIESDVIEAFHYWTEQRLMEVEEQNGAIAVRFAKGGARPEPPSPKTRSGREEADKPAPSKVVRVEHKPTYSPEELAVYQANPKIAGLFAKAASCLGAPLSPVNLSVLFSFYDYYRLPLDVIEFLMDHCVQNGGRSLRYMEKVAQDWSDQGIQTVEKAREYVQRFSSYRPILNALHVRAARPSDSDLVYLNRWLHEYQMPQELIVEACSRTWQRTGQPSFQYADSILDNWHAQGVRTMEDVAKADESFQRSHGVPAGSNRSADGFHSYIRHDDWDYDALERLARNQLYTDHS